MDALAVRTDVVVEQPWRQLRGPTAAIGTPFTGASGDRLAPNVGIEDVLFVVGQHPVDQWSQLALISDQWSQLALISWLTCPALAPRFTVKPIAQPIGWLPSILEKIESLRKVDATSTNGADDEAALDPASVRAARLFFEEAADLLPTVPVIYPSLLGDLIIEFGEPTHLRTVVVTPKYIVISAATPRGIAIEQLDDWQGRSDRLREALEKLDMAAG